MSIIDPNYQRAKQKALELAETHIAAAAKAGLSPQDTLAGFMSVFLRHVDKREISNLALLCGAVCLWPGPKELISTTFAEALAKRIGE